MWLECASCGAKHEIGPTFGGCPECRGRARRSPLEVRYDYRAARGEMPMPFLDEPVSLGGGDTPLLPLRQWHGPSRLYLKNESLNPTWSWKDRANTVSVSMARSFGFSLVGAVSTGNHGNAMAAHAAAAGLGSVVFCHENAPALQLALMQSYGARVYRGGRQEELLGGLVALGKCFPCSILCPRAGYSNPYGVEGFKPIALEIFQQLGRKVPDRVFVPVGSGDGIFGVWKGFWELQQMGLSDRTPRMMACQSENADSTWRAFRRRSLHHEELGTANTVALSIGERIAGDHALRAVYDSNGAALIASDAEILDAARTLAHEGLALEPASAAPLACARKCA
ncbi:MAG: pyridoxal-phosphate dependent enzyme, partial [Bryobacteraceae bacterium]